MPSARLVPLSDDDVARWRDGRGSWPEPDGADELEALEVLVDDVAVGGTVLSHRATRTTVRLLETSLADDDLEHWRVVLAALEAHAARRGSTSLTTAVSPRLVAAFQHAGFGSTMTAVGITVAPERARINEDDGSVSVRPMTAEERRAFVPAAREILRTGMEGAGVLDDPGASMDPVDRRLAGLVDDPPGDELLLVAVVDGTPVGRFWGTLVTRGAQVDLDGNTIDLFPEHRGRGLMRPFMAALETHVREHGLRDVRGRLYGQDRRARTTLVGMGVGLDEVHLRKDLAHPTG